MPGNESVTDNMKSFVGGVALKQAFYNIKTYNAQAISTAITNHNADAAHRHLPAVPTTSPPTGTFSYLTNSQTPAWSTLPTSDAVDSSSSSQLATSKAVSTLNTNLTNNINSHFAGKGLYGNTAYNMNNRTDPPGLYYCYATTNGPNGNPAINAHIRLAYSNDWIVQIYFGIDDPAEFWIRHFHSGTTWTAWKCYKASS